MSLHFLLCIGVSQSCILCESTKLSLLCKSKVTRFKEFWVQRSVPAIPRYWHQVAVELFLYVLSSLEYHEFHCRQRTWAKTLDKNMFTSKKQQQTPPQCNLKKMNYIENTNRNLTYIFHVFFSITKLKNDLNINPAKDLFPIFSFSQDHSY